MKITIELDDNETNHMIIKNNGWVDGIDRCANCPNNPNNPNGSNYGGFCHCTIPSMFGPNRIVG